MRTLLSKQTYAGVAIAAIGLFAFGALTSRSSAFTLIERQLAFDPIEINLDQTAHIVVNNTFGAQQVHVTINWGDAITGAAIGSPFDANLAPGHGAVALLPAIQPPVNSLPAVQRAIIAKLTLSPAQGAGMPPIFLGNLITGNLEVIDNATGHVSLARGFATIPAVQ